MIPAVYMAGPVDYIEHRSPGQHRTDNWRHRFFGDLPIDLLCPTCLNAGPVVYFPELPVAAYGEPLPDTEIMAQTRPRTSDDIMHTNKEAMERANYFVGYFPGDAATFGTPIETWHWTTQASIAGLQDHAVLVHPARPGVFVEYLHAVSHLAVVRSFEEARSWLQHRLSAV